MTTTYEPRVHVIGLGLEPDPLLPPAARRHLDAAEVLVAGRRQLDLFADHPAEKLPVTAPVSKILDRVQALLAEGRRVVALADGDPLCFGLGATLADRLGRDRVRVWPNVGAVQAAAARLALPWHEARVVSLHGRGDYAPLFAGLTHAPLTAVYTDRSDGPAEIGAAIAQRLGDAPCDLHVFEDLAGPDERHRRLSPAQAAAADFREPNIVLIPRPEPAGRLRLGIPDEAFEHQAGLLTKGPVRAVGLAGLELSPGDTLWDLGAASGAVAVEAARLLTHGQVQAVERDPVRLEMLRRNAATFGAWLVEPVAGKMPRALENLATPDAVFLGGGLRNPEVLELACERLRPGGRLVAHLILLESLDNVRRQLSHRLWPWTLQQVAVHRAEPLAGSCRLAPINPVFIVSARKP